MNPTTRHKNIRLEFVSRDHIEIGDRVRTTLNGKSEGESLEELASSITMYGSVLEPVVLMDKATATGPLDKGHYPDRPYRLVAGERRFCSHLDADIGNDIAAIIFEGWSMAELRNAEFDENKIRKSMTPAEEILAIKRYHIHLVHAAAAEGKEWAIRDTATKTGKSKTNIHATLQQAEAIEANPELKNATSKKEITSKIKRNIRQTTVAKISAMVDLQYKLKGNKDDKNQELIASYKIGNFLTTKFKKGFQLVEFDPDYGFGLEEKRKTFAESGKDRMEGYGYLAEEFKDFTLEALQKSYDLMSNDSWLWVWGDMEYATWIQNAIRKVGFIHEPWQYFVWCKPTGQCRQPLYNKAAATELMWYARKGSPHMQIEGKKNWREYRIPVREGRHPTEKPIELYEMLLSEFTFRGARVLAPCAGSYNIGFAADNLDMKPEGTDITKGFRDEFVSRVAEGKKPWRSY